MNTMPAISDCKLYELPKITDPRGNLTFIESDKHVPFAIQRVFYLYDVPTEESRGAHAHHTLNQLIICLSGSFDVEVDDGKNRTRIHLNRPWKGLHVPPLIWAAEVNFDPGSVALILASDMYNEADYIRDYDDYLALMKDLASKRD
ncbi:sugar 3,4-ketoisomerase [Paraburkholderia xenovorans]|uniref:sugar 3,4-ketoisomerase n=1 Tax=Paraburkholderia xenovorans TaxID=36873 RepID=UPI0038BD6BDF